MSAFSILGPPNNEITAGLLGWWTFDEGSLCEDRSGNGHHIIVKGSAVTKGNGRVLSRKRRGSYQCAGSNYLQDGVQISNFPTIFNSTWSVTAWIKTAGAATRGTVISNVNNLANLGGPPFVTLWTKKISSWPNTGGPTLLSTSNVDDNFWHHIAVTSGTDCRIYVDGVLDCTPGAAQGGNGTVYGGPFIGGLGAAGSGLSTASYYLDGEIDEVRYYTRALTAFEVHTIYSNAFLPNVEDEMSALLIPPAGVLFGHNIGGHFSRKVTTIGY